MRFAARLISFFAFSLLLVLSPRAVAGKKRIVPRLEDIKYIECEVCEQIAENLIRQVGKKKENIAPKKITELHLIEITERICDVKREEGDWIQWFDIVEDGDKLKLVQQNYVGVCGTECKTIEKACSKIIGYHDTDVAEALYSGQSRASISNLLCRQLSKSCTKKVPPVPKDRKPGEPFVKKDSKEIEMETMMRKLNDAPSFPGMPKMKMYSREEILERGMGKGMKGDDDDDDDEDDENNYSNNGAKERQEMEMSEERLKEIIGNNEHKQRDYSSFQNKKKQRREDAISNWIDQKLGVMKHNVHLAYKYSHAAFTIAKRKSTLFFNNALSSIANRQKASKRNNAPHGNDEL